MIRDLARLKRKYGITDFFFMDDFLADDLEWFRKLIRALAAASKDYCWGAAGIRANAILKLTDKDMEYLVKSGCKNIDIGVESGNERVLKLIQKDITPEKVRKANLKMRNYPIVCKFTFMAGFPTETEQEFRDTLNFRRLLLKENRNAVSPIFNYTPFPRTPLYGLAVREGARLPSTLEGWADFNYYTWYKKYPSWLTRRMIRLIDTAVFLSYFADDNLSYKYSNPPMSLVFRLYHPIAKFRYEHNIYGFMVEQRVADLVRSQQLATATGQ